MEVCLVLLAVLALVAMVQQTKPAQQVELDMGSTVEQQGLVPTITLVTTVLVVAEEQALLAETV